MASKTISCALVFSMVCSVLVFADNVDCRNADAYDSGYEAGRTHDRFGWGLWGGALAFSGSLASFMILSKQGESTMSFIGLESASLGIGATVSGITMVFSLASKPQPQFGIPSGMSAEERACYLEGYRKAARRRNVSRAAIGSAGGLVGYCGFAILTGLGLSLFTGGEWDPWVD
jgi:hypothetical protein